MCFAFIWTAIAVAERQRWVVKLTSHTILVFSVSFKTFIHWVMFKKDNECQHLTWKCCVIWCTCKWTGVVKCNQVWKKDFLSKNTFYYEGYRLLWMKILFLNRIDFNPPFLPPLLPPPFPQLRRSFKQYLKMYLMMMLYKNVFCPKFYCQKETFQDFKRSFSERGEQNMKWKRCIVFYYAFWRGLLGNYLC